MFCIEIGLVILSSQVTNTSSHIGGYYRGLDSWQPVLIHIAMKRKIHTQQIDLSKRTRWRQRRGRGGEGGWASYAQDEYRANELQNIYCNGDIDK